MAIHRLVRVSVSVQVKVRVREIMVKFKLIDHGEVTVSVRVIVS